MKRILFLIGVLLLSHVMRAQSVRYACRYWFDQDQGQMVMASANDNLLQMELDASSLSPGIHLLFIQVKDSTDVWCPPQQYMFYKPLTEQPANMDNVVYHCWFDEDIEHIQSGLLGTGQFLLNADDLAEGLHLLYVNLESSSLTTTKSYMFYKAFTEQPASMDNVVYHCWFDHDYSTVQTGSLGNGIFELDTEALTGGIHILNVQLDNGTLAAPQHYMFYKKLEREQIARWEFWLNDEVNNRHTTNLSPFMDSLSIISLLPVETRPVRSTCFHFHPNGDEPYLNAKNKITFKFWSTQRHFIEESTYYIDENVVEPIVADTLERNTTVSIAAPRDNQIHWFKLAANRGDYLTFQANKACTMQLFAPSGEEVYSASGHGSLQETGFNVWEDGAYYLAVHDANGSEDSISITYNWFYRYAVLVYDVHLVGNGGCSTITFQGNGFNSLLDAYLVNAQNDTIRSLDIGHESNTTTTVSCNFYQANQGVYDAVFEFYEETIRINGALEVQEPVDIYLTSSVSYPSSFMSGNTVTYTFTITNNGNMSAYVVPLYLYVASPTPESITHLEIEGLNLPTLADYMNLDSLPAEDVKIIREWARAKGDDHYFNLFSAVENKMGRNVAVRTNFFFVNLAPFESKTIKLKITATTGAHEPIEVWMTVPNEVIQPHTLVPNREVSTFCCAMDHIGCFVSIMSYWGNIGAFIADAIAFALPAIAEPAIVVNIASCIVSSANAVVELLDDIFCNEEQGFWNNLLWPFKKSGWSFVSTALSCLSAFHSFKDLENAANLSKPKDLLDLGLDKFIYRMQALGDVIVDVLASVTGGALENNPSCVFTSETVNCFSGNKIGGQTDGQTPGDPNDIHGYLSESGSHYIRQEIQNIHYEIEFENDTTLATAAAHTIIVRDTLDATKFDLNSLAARSVTIGDKRLELNGEQSFVRTLDMRPELYVIAQINQDYDPETGIVEWTIQSLDPMTMEPIVDPNLGVLPVNYFGDGVGFIDYSINLKETFADGTEISNRAGIIFDQEDIIMTPTWTNTVDAVKPTSHIEEVTPVADSLSFSFVSEDNRSGVWYHSLYYRNASTEQEWQVRKAQIFEESFVLHLEDLQTTEYLVIAVDSAGNREDKDMVAEYIYTASGLHFVTEGNWSTASNWQEGTLPGADDVAFIDASCQLDQDAEVAALAIADGQTFTMQSGKTLTVNGLLFNSSTAGLVIKDGAQLINASGNVAATMEKDIAAYSNSNPDAWYTIASPMNEMPIEGSSFATPEFDLYRYNESNFSNKEWENYKGGLTDFTTFENGRGYLFANSNAFSPAFIGTLNSSAVSCPLSYTERPNDPLSGFNLIGNPFPHDIYKGVGAAIDNANLASGYYTLTNEGTWQVHTFEDAIHPGQGILVRTTAPTVLTIAKSTAVATAETGGAKRKASPLSISVKGENGQDQTFVYFGRGNSMEKMGGFVTQESSLWVRNKGKDYAIAHVENANESLELCFSSKQSGDFTLTVDRNEKEFEYLQLFDHVTGLTVDLLKQPTYSFHATGQEPDARFSIRFKVME